MSGETKNRGLLNKVSIALLKYIPFIVSDKTMNITSRIVDMAKVIIAIFNEPNLTNLITAIKMHT